MATASAALRATFRRHPLPLAGIATIAIIASVFLAFSDGPRNSVAASLATKPTSSHPALTVTPIEDAPPPPQPTVTVQQLEELRRIAKHKESSRNRRPERSKVVVKRPKTGR